MQHPGWVKVDHPKAYWLPIEQVGDVDDGFSALALRAREWDMSLLTGMMFGADWLRALPLDLRDLAQPQATSPFLNACPCPCVIFPSSFPGPEPVHLLSSCTQYGKPVIHFK